MDDDIALVPPAPTVPVHGSLDQYRRLIESLVDYAIFELSFAGEIVSWNLGATQTFGFAERDVLGKNYSVLFTEEDIEKGRPEAELRASVELGKSAVDGWHIRKDGSRFWCTDTVQPLRGEDGKIVGFTKIVRDSDEFHRNWMRLRKNEARLRAIIEGVAEYAIISVGPDGRIEHWNAGANKLYGYSPAEVVGKHYSLLFSPEAEARSLADNELATAARDGHAVDESWHLRRGGEIFFSSGQIQRLPPEEDGSPSGFVKLSHDITARNKADEQLKLQAFRDELTNLPNRAFFTDCLRRLIASCKRHPEKRFAVIFIDLDHFKNINDSLGHLLADTLLTQVARALEKCVRPEDVVARMGGDEFTILISDIGASGDAASVAERMHAALRGPFIFDGTEIVVSASMGITLGSGTYDDPEQVLHDADTAMYEAKTRGRAAHVTFDDSMRGRMVKVVTRQMDLRRAVSQKDFLIEYQPTVLLATRAVTGFEALIRWNHPNLGVLSPADFIPEAEQMGLILEIDQWVLNAACKQLREWQVDSGDPALTISVNLSSKQFRHESLVGEIRNTLRRNNLAAESLKLEITETALMERLDSTSRTIRGIVALGVQLYIDDFGTGYSSLSYLTRFPLTLLKVDRSFVSLVSLDSRSAIVAKTIINLAHSLGLTALAEGIETRQQFEEVLRLGCDFGQGFWLSRPLSPNLAQGLIGKVLPLN